MKILIGLFILISAICNGQTYIAPIIGANFSTYNVTNYQGPKLSSKSGLTIGLGLIFENQKKISLKTEFRYSSMGQSVNVSTSQYNSHVVTTNQNYLTAHLLMKLKFSNTNNTRGYFEIGPRYGHGVGEITVDSGSSIASKSWEDAHLDRTDYGIETGLGVDCNFGSNRLDLDLRYFLGLKNYNLDNTYEIRNSGFILSACLYILP